MGWRAMFRPGMRVYFVPLTAAIALTSSAFLPWVIVGGVSLNGIAATWGYWIVGLGTFASILAILSLITRKNSRHPLLVVGLAALGIMMLSWRILPLSAGERALTRAQAYAIVENRPIGEAPDAVVGNGIYLGFTAASVIVAFGLTIVVKRAGSPYVLESADDDV